MSVGLPYLCCGKRRTMALFNHKISLTKLLREIPEAELSRIAKASGVDHYTKVLHGKLMFYLLLYGLLKVDRLSQRGLRDAFRSPFFRTIFDFHGKKEISHSSISERLATINVDFFRGAYDVMYKRLCSLYTSREIACMNLQRVDSTLVVESSNKLREGLTCGNGGNKGKMLKYTLNFNGMFASLANVHSDDRYASEIPALSENVLEHFKREEDHSLVYLFDRGQCSAEAFKELKAEAGLQFVGRLQKNRRTKVVKQMALEDSFDQGTLQQDSLVKLYKRYEYVNEKGVKVRQSVLVDEVFRVIRFTPLDREEDMLLITNMEKVPASEVAAMYRRRWDIEVFFRFLKQELNFSHFLSLNENGIQVVLYMTLITAMLVMIYKKENEIGYKTAVRRMGMELESLIMAIIVIQSGGDLKKTELPDP